jgi:DNA primase
MSGIDYREVRARIPMSRVLELLAYQPKTRKGHQLRGPCPIHGSSNPHSDVFAAHLGKQVYYCHHCRSGGDQLKLWQAIQKQPLYWATLKLCQATQIEPPWLNPNRLSSCKSRPQRSSRNR